VLTMCNEDGKSTGKTVKLQPEDDPRLVASRLLRKEMLKQPRSDFNRGSSIRNMELPDVR
jgi:hypothetical protein